MTTYTIGELAQEFDVTTRAIRFYEDQGLLSPTRNGQARIYTARDRVRLKLVLRGKRLGFSLGEVGKMLDLYDADPSEVGQLQYF
ncbi:MAG: MerR family DNA-binding transcriptional regulator, partial [Acidiferrobacterales bacterium]